MDEDGKPVVGALVRCVRVESLVELAKEWLPTSSGWKLPVEAEISTGQDGKYEFAHLPIGARTFFYSAPGRDLAPAIKDLIVVQDGLGAQLDVTLARPKVLRVQLGWSSIKPTPRFHLIPHRWWPDIITVPVARGADSVEFRGLGGPFRKGLIAVSAAGESSPLRVIARYDLDRHENITLPRPGDRASRFDIPEAGGLEPLDQPLTPAVRLFYAALSPIALFWVPDVDIGPLKLPLDEFVQSIAAHVEHGAVRGFSANPFLPVLVRSPLSADVLAWTSEASEFEVGGLPGGRYRARALDLFGRVTFASGALVGPPQTSIEGARLWEKLDLDEPDCREVMGLVRWENGAPAAKAVVFMQHSYDFRKYVRRVECDALGYFRFSDVPGNAPYFLFAVPPGSSDAMRLFDHFGVGNLTREVWRELTLSPHCVTGAVPRSMALSEAKSAEPMRRARGGLSAERSSQADVSAVDVQLVRLEGQTELIVWTVRAEAAEKFSVSNVMHGRYQARVRQDNGKGGARSLPFDVGDGQTETTVRWPTL